MVLSEDASQHSQMFTHINSNVLDGPTIKEPHRESHSAISDQHVNHQVQVAAFTATADCISRHGIQLLTATMLCIQRQEQTATILYKCT